ncbi:MAG: copper amine oxidase N-terminal domain-containing protein [Defluviitaleaceae bacterium]|nr:copper amine oxidase N-terminal domain-containing protein [Defluviitaleaceae bacterium]
MKKRLFLVCVMAILLIMTVACTSEIENAEAVEPYQSAIDIFTDIALSGSMENEHELAPIEVGDIWERQSIDELAHGATDIVRARVLNYEVKMVNTSLSGRPLSELEEELFVLPHVVHRLEVLEVFMGSGEVGDIIYLAQEDYSNSIIVIPYDFFNPLEYGEELIFFLHNFERFGFGHLPMVLESSFQAIYRTAPPDSGPETVLESVHPFNDLILTIGDLERIAEEYFRPSPLPTSRPPASNNTGSGQESEEEPQESTPQPSPQTAPTPSPSPIPASEDDEIEDDTPIILLRFVIGSLYYTNHEGTTLIGDAEPFIAGNRAHVPLRIIAEALGAEVTWSRSTRTGYMTKDDITVSIVVNQPLPDGMGMPVIINNRTFVPARYISETFGAEVRWDRDNSAVYVYWPQ